MPITRFKRKQLSYVRGVEEPPKRRFPLGKYIYIVVLAGILVWAGNLLARRYLFIEGRGILDPVVIEVKPKITARILENKLRVEQWAKEGDPLTILDQTDILREIASKDREHKQESAQLHNKIFDARRELDSFHGKKEKEEGRLRDAGAELGRARKLMTREAITRTQVLVLEKEFRDAQRETALMAAEITACAGKLTQLEAEYAAFVSSVEKEKEHFEERLKETVVRSPRPALVTEILKQPGELVQPVDVIMRVVDPSEMVVKGYFDAAHEASIKPGDLVDIIFEDGYRTRGKILKVYPEALAMAMELKKPYGPLERAIVTEIAPVKDEPWARILKTKPRLVLDKANWWPFK